jgi:hypothetical protein
MNPKIVSDVPCQEVQIFTRTIVDQVARSVTEINALARIDPSCPHRFGMKVVEVRVIGGEKDNLRVWYRTLSSIKADDYTFRTCDPRERGNFFFANRENPQQLAMHSSSASGVAEYIGMICIHQYRKLVSILAIQKGFVSGS